MALAQKQTGRPTEQNRIPSIKSCFYSQMIFDKNAQKI
jgi:hypothetical protein